MDNEEGAVSEYRSGRVKHVIGVNESPNPAEGGSVRSQSVVGLLFNKLIELLHAILVEK